MLIQITDKKYAKTFAAIYNSANTLYGESMRADAAPELFCPQIKEDENFMEVSDSGEGLAFISWHRYGAYFELTSLYVRRENQKEGLGHKLLRHLEKQVPKGGTIFVKVLKNAPWARAFYHKNGYLPIDGQMRESARSLGIVEKNWSVVLRKNRF